MSAAGVLLWMTFAVLVDRVVVHWERVLEVVGRIVEGQHERQVLRCVRRHPAKPFRPTIEHVRVVRPGDDVRWLPPLSWRYEPPAPDSIDTSALGINLHDGAPSPARVAFLDGEG